MLLVKDSHQAAQHAADRGLIAAQLLEDVRADREEDISSDRPAV
jgi:hypothetical protein